MTSGVLPLWIWRRLDLTWSGGAMRTRVSVLSP